MLWDGTVVPCCLDHEGDIPLGNLYQKTLEEILDSPQAQNIYNGFSSGEGLFQRRQNSVIQLVCSLRIWAVQEICIRKHWRKF